MFLEMDKILFGQWLQKEREKRDLSQSDLARLTGLHRQIINKTENGVSMPAVETYLALAKAFSISPITIFRKAGLLPEGGEQVSFDDWQYLLNQLTPEEEEEIRQITEMKIERRKKAEMAERAKKFKPKKAG